MRTRLSVILLGCFFTIFYSEISLAQLKVAGLRCEYLNNPIGIDVKNPRLSWQLQIFDPGSMQAAYEIRAAKEMSAVKEGTRLLWNTGKISSDTSTQVVYGGPDLYSRQRVYWQVRVWDNHGHVSPWSEPAYWEVGLLTTAEWDASWITSGFNENILRPDPSPYFRKGFNLGKKIRSARLYVTSLGLYQVLLNGRKVGDRLFTPGFTSYNKRLQYQTYDVTQQVSGGSNAIGVILGDGWYRGHLGWQKNNRNRYGDKSALLLQLEITYRDGTKQSIVSDGSWKVNTGGIRSSDIYEGETFDARKVLTDWTMPHFDDGRWPSVQLLEHSKDILVASSSEPVKKIQEIRPVSIIITPEGDTVLDMGQNMVGWVRLKVQGRRGDTVILRFAEVLDKKGNFYTANLRSAKAADRYILKGEGEEVYEPHFTFHGFQYVKVQGYPGKLDLKDITGIVIHSAMEPAGSFECSDPMINQLWHNIIWSQKDNFLDIPTDCPQRDERLGWTGDINVFSPTAAYNYNVAAFLSKWLQDLAADQLEDGAVPDVVPDILNLRKGQGVGGRHTAAASTGWADAAVTIPWNLYLYYGDKRILEEQYASMAAWVSYMKDQAGEKLLWTGGEHYGDWLSFSSNSRSYPGAYTDKDFIATAYFAHAADLLSKIARVLGKDKEAEKYRTLFKNIKRAFNKEYVTPAGRVMSNTQTAYAMAIEFDLLPEDKVAPAAEYLAEDVSHFKHITTGFLGTPLINPVLSETGYDSLAYMLLQRKEYPSWLYPITRGATTIWERWDGIKPDGSFQNPAMNSFNHYAYGAIGYWLYTVVAGIKPDPEHPGFRHFVLAPQPGGGLTYAKASYKSMYGKIISDWKIKDGNMIYTVQIPPNSTAQITLPQVGDSRVYINNEDIKDYGSGRSVKRNGNKLSFNIGSGNYKLNYKLSEN